MIVVNVFLPTMKGTKLSFMRDVLADKKLHLKQNEVIRLDIPGYQELSVKNLYEDAMKDLVLTKYLPTKEQLSNKLPEREFFFGILCTLRKQYMKDIIQAASSKRFKVGEDDPKKQGIAISDSWFQDLMKHPYHSSKQYVINHVEKTGTGIFMMKEHAKCTRHRGSARCTPCRRGCSKRKKRTMTTWEEMKAGRRRRSSAMEPP
jgi:hypothetical protein